MKAYRLRSIHTVESCEMEAQAVGENCVKLKNLVLGIASDDIAAYSGKLSVTYPIIPVRQCVGFVSEVGAGVKGLQRGNRVVVYPQSSCNNCKACKDARYYDCEKPAHYGIDEDGFLSDFSVVSANDVYAIPERIKDEEAVYTEHTAIAINIMSALGVEKGEHLIIVGATTIGIILAQVAMYYQAVPIVVDMFEERLDVARAAGVYYTINAVNEDVSKKVLALTGGHMADAGAYFVSSTMPFQNVADYTKKRGRVALVGIPYNDELKCNLSGFVEKNIGIETVIDCGKNYPSAINMLANHTVNVEILPKRTIGFADVPAAFDELGKSDIGGLIEKVLVKV